MVQCAGLEGMKRRWTCAGARGAAPRKFLLDSVRAAIWPHDAYDSAFAGRQ